MPDHNDHLAARMGAEWVPSPLESYEVDDGICALCGEAYALREIDRGHCQRCDDFADCEPFMY